jgi:hypothetical protein
VLLLVVLLSEFSVVLFEKSEYIIPIRCLVFLQMFKQDLKLNHIGKMEVQSLKQDRKRQQ